jgi:CRISPR-associated protein Csm5
MATYKVTTLTPLLVGDGQELSPVDYMVWKDQVNVLDQPRIFRLLSRGPRLEGYLTQLRKADKLDFASWGGFAQNFSERRIPFEHSSSTAIWEKTATESLFIPTFAASHQGAYLPGSALKGALRTGLVFTRWSAGTMEKLAASMSGDRLPRHPAEALETGAGATQTRILATADSTPIPRSALKVFLTRVANLDTRPGSAAQASWKVAGRGNVPAARINESTPTFVEMAVPGTEFSGSFFERKFLEDQQFTRSLGWRSVPDLELFIKSANEYAAAQLEQHDRFAQAASLTRVQQSLARLQGELETARGSRNSCLLCLGWGSGFLSKAAFIDSTNENLRKVLRGVPAFGRALKNDMPFPKTRRIIFSGGQPGYLPGWVKLELQA